MTQSRDENNQNGCSIRPSAPICSGRGNCLCKRCECHRPDTDNPLHGVTGDYCQLDNFSCARANGMLCSGPEHGECLYGGECACNGNWTGTACDCRVDQCLSPRAGLLSCSGHGQCECGECKCDRSADGWPYVGEFCDKCPSCPKRCEELRACVECWTGDDRRQCPTNCTTELVEKPTDELPDEYLCQAIDARDCKYSFSYVEPAAGDTLSPIRVRVQQQRDCPPLPNEAIVALAVIASVLLIGLGSLLLWKWLTSLHDHREYAKFMQDSSMETWEETDNPIFRKTTTTTVNPMYNRDD